MDRKLFLTATAIAAAGLSACGKGAANELELVEPASQFDYAAFVKLVDRPSDVRQLWEAGRFVPPILGAIKNAYNGYQFGYGIKPERIAMALCLHGNANAWAYDDSMWQKYQLGEFFSFRDPGGNIVASNVFARMPANVTQTNDPNDVHGPYQQASIEALERRGLTVLVCHAGAAEHARDLVEHGAAQNTTPAAVLEDLLGHLIPGATVVPSQVATIGLLQSRFRYAYTTA